jgi:hypothetical protein
MSPGIGRAIGAADFAAVSEWNGRRFIKVGALIERRPGDNGVIAAFYRRIEDALAPFGYTHFSARALMSGGVPVWRAMITLVGPGEWTDRKFVDDLIAGAS